VHIALPFDQDSWTTHVAERGKKALKAFYAMSKRGLRWGRKRAVFGIQVYKQMIAPILFYGTEVIDPTEPQLAELDRIQALILKKIIGLPKYAATEWTLWEAGVLTSRLTIDKMKLGLWWRHQREKTVKHSNSRVHKTKLGLENQSMQALQRWKVDPTEVWVGGVQGPQNLIIRTQAGWNKKSKIWAVEAAKRRFHKWSEQKQMKEPGGIPMHVTKPNFVEQLQFTQNWDGDTVHRFVRLRSDSFGFQNDYSRRSRPAAATRECFMCGMYAYESAAHGILCCPGNKDSAGALSTALERHPRLARSIGETLEHQLARVLQAIHAEHSDEETETVEAALADLLETLTKSRPLCTKW
jgi:hypothetical protein